MELGGSRGNRKTAREDQHVCIGAGDGTRTDRMLDPCAGINGLMAARLFADGEVVVRSKNGEEARENEIRHRE